MSQGTTAGRKARYAGVPKLLPESQDYRFRDETLVENHRYRNASLPERKPVKAFPDSRTEKTKQLKTLKDAMGDSTALADILKGEHKLYNWLIIQALKIEKDKDSPEQAERQRANEMTASLDAICQGAAFDWRSIPLSPNYLTANSAQIKELGLLLPDDLDEKTFQEGVGYFLPPWSEKRFASGTFMQVYLLYWEVRQKFGNISTKNGLGLKDFVSLYPELHAWMKAFREETDFERYGLSRLEVEVMRGWLGTCEESANDLPGYSVWSWEEAAKADPDERYKPNAVLGRYKSKFEVKDLQPLEACLETLKEVRKGRSGKRSGQLAPPSKRVKRKEVSKQPPSGKEVTDLTPTRREAGFGGDVESIDSEPSSYASSSGQSAENSQKTKPPESRKLRGRKRTRGASLAGSQSSSSGRSTRSSACVSPTKSTASSEDKERIVGRGHMKRVRYSGVLGREETYHFSPIPEKKLKLFAPGMDSAQPDEEFREESPDSFTAEELEELALMPREEEQIQPGGETLQVEKALPGVMEAYSKGAELLSSLLSQLSDLRERFSDEHSELSLQEAMDTASSIDAQVRDIKLCILALGHGSGDLGSMDTEEGAERLHDSRALAVLDELGRLRGNARRFLLGIATELHAEEWRTKGVASKLRAVREFHGEAALPSDRLQNYLLSPEQKRERSEHSYCSYQPLVTGSLDIPLDLLRSTKVKLARYCEVKEGQEGVDITARNLMRLYKVAVDKLRQDYKGVTDIFEPQVARLRFEKVAWIADHLRRYIKNVLAQKLRIRSQLTGALSLLVDEPTPEHYQEMMALLPDHLRSPEIVQKAVHLLSEDTEKYLKQKKLSSHFLPDPVSELQPEGSGLLSGESESLKLSKQLGPQLVVKTEWDQFVVSSNKTLHQAEMEELLRDADRSGSGEIVEGVKIDSTLREPVSSAKQEEALSLFLINSAPDPVLVKALGAMEILRNLLGGFQSSLKEISHTEYFGKFDKEWASISATLTAAADKL